MATVAKQPTAIWLDHIAAITATNQDGSSTGRKSLDTLIQEALKQGSSTTPVVMEIVIYDLPQRDCAALASNGELSIKGSDIPTGGTKPLTDASGNTETGIQEYEHNYIDQIAAVLSNYSTNASIRFVLVVEDDSLPNLITNTGIDSITYPYTKPCTAANGGVDNTSAPQNWTTTATPDESIPMTGVYTTGISYALNTFHKQANVYNYLDIGHHGWLGWTSNMAYAVKFFNTFAQQLDDKFATIDGIITNTANYGPTVEPYLKWDMLPGGAIAPISSLSNAIFTGDFYQWNPEIDELSYAEDFYTALTSPFSTGYTDPRGQAHTPGGGFPTTIGFLIDTSRNGWGNLTASNGGGLSSYTTRPNVLGTSTTLATFVNESKIDLRNSSGQWCNQENAGIGALPTFATSSDTNTGYYSVFPNLQAYVWIKPPGESDGNYPGSVYNGVTATGGDPNCNPTVNNQLAGADTEVNSMPNGPSAGTFWPAQFIQLVEDANPALGGSANTAPVLSSISPTSGAAGSTITITGTNLGSSDSVDFGSTAATITASSSTSLTVTVPSSLVAGTSYNVTVSSSGGTSNPESFTVTGISTPTVTASASSVTVQQGNSATDTITVAGFSSSVTLAASYLPSGVTAAYSVNPTTGTSVLTLSASSSATTGSSTISVTGTAGSQTVSTSITLTVNPSSCIATSGWSTKGNQIIDPNGNPFRIEGVNWYGAETSTYVMHGLYSQDYKVILNQVKSSGFNTVRIPFSNEAVETNPNVSNQINTSGGMNTGLTTPTTLGVMDSVILYAGSIGLHVILDNHRSEAGNSNEASGLWYNSSAGYSSAQWVSDWQTLATRYSASQFSINGVPIIIGMDLRNEPHLMPDSGTSPTGSCWTGDAQVSGNCATSNTAQNWPVAAEAAGNAILAVNPNFLIFVEGLDCYNNVSSNTISPAYLSCDWQGGNLQGVANYPVVLNVSNHVVYSPHDYGPDCGYTQLWETGSTTYSTLEQVWNTNWAYISTQGIAPVWVGELGVDHNGDESTTSAGSNGQWFTSLIQFLGSNPNISWSYWALNGEDSMGLENSTYSGIESPDGQTIVSDLTAIQTANSTSSSTGSAATAGFTLSVSPTSLMIAQGSSGTATITVVDTGCFTGTVTFTTSTLPSGVTASFSGNVLTVSVGSSATVGTSTVTITGTSGSLSATTSLALTVTGKGLSLSLNPSSLSLVQGASGTITITPTGASSGISYAVSGLPSGVTGTFNGNVLTLVASSTATTGSFQPVITATSGSLSATATFTLTVTAKGSGVCSVVYTISPQNNIQFGGNLTITNTGTTAWTNWTLTWSFANGQTVSSLWNGLESQSGANVTVANQSYNGSIAAGASYSGAGFNGTWNGVTNAIPTNFAINGTACNGPTLTPTTTTLSSFATNTTTGTNVTLTAAVAPPAANGTVTFYDGTTSLGTGTLSSGTATLATSFSTAGTHSITAVYGGSTTYATSTSSVVSITVTGSLTPTTTTLSSSTTTPKAGANFTLTATVSPSAATGTVTFYSGTTALGTGTINSGVATLSTSIATAGSYSLTAVYGGSTTYATSTSSAVGITVSSNSSACTVNYTISPQGPSAFGATIAIINNGTTALSNWTLTWTFANGQTISGSWNGSASQSGATVSVSEQAGQSWENIPAGGSYSGFGFNGTWNGTTNAIPTAIYLNGTSCTVN
jgi:endoglucanase